MTLPPKILGSDCFTGKIYQTSKEQISFSVYKFVPENKKGDLIHFYNTSIILIPRTDVMIFKMHMKARLTYAHRELLKQDIVQLGPTEHYKITHTSLQ